MLLPKLKKELKSFFLDEDGLMSKSNILKIGLLASAASLGASNVQAGHATCLISSQMTNIPAGYTLVGPNPMRSYWFHVWTDEDLNDDGNVFCGPTDANYDSAHPRDELSLLNAECDQDYFIDEGIHWMKIPDHHNAGETEYTRGYISFDDVDLHKNGISLGSGSPTEIVAQHEHSVIECKDLNTCKYPNRVDFWAHGQDGVRCDPNFPASMILAFCKSNKLGIDGTDPAAPYPYRHCAS